MIAPPLTARLVEFVRRGPPEVRLHERRAVQWAVALDDTIHRLRTVWTKDRHALRMSGPDHPVKPDTPDGGWTPGGNSTASKNASVRSTALRLCPQPGLVRGSALSRTPWCGLAQAHSGMADLPVSRVPPDVPKRILRD